jgi:hypothetical protein
MKQNWVRIGFAVDKPARERFKDCAFQISGQNNIWFALICITNDRYTRRGAYVQGDHSDEHNSDRDGAHVERLIGNLSSLSPNENQLVKHFPTFC